MNIKMSDLVGACCMVAFLSAAITWAVTFAIVTTNFHREAIAAGVATFVVEPDQKGHPVFKWVRP